MDFDFVERMLPTVVAFNLLPELWEEVQIEGFDFTQAEWKETKFLNDTGTVMHDGMNDLPRDKGGIYLFIIRSNIIPGCTDYLVYIGRAYITEGQHLKKRCRSYHQKYVRNKERVKIERMIHYWGKHLYLRYLELDDEEIIKQLEIQLINSILPPFNDQIPNKRTRDAVAAFP